MGRDPTRSTGHLTDDEIHAFIGLLSGAGNETVARFLGWAAIGLEEFPDERALLAAQPALIPNGVEEILRWEAPSPIQGRWTLHDVELHGTVISAGSKVAFLTGAANRDEYAFDEPDVTHVILLIDDTHVRVVHATTGELLRDLTINTSRDYQPTGRPPGSTPTPK